MSIKYGEFTIHHDENNDNILILPRLSETDFTIYRFVFEPIKIRKYKIKNQNTKFLISINSIQKLIKLFTKFLVFLKSIDAPSVKSAFASPIN